MVSLDTAAGNARIQLGINGSNNVAAAQSESGGTVVTATSTATADADVLYHTAGVFASSTSRTAYLNGVAGTANTTANTFTAPNSVRLGARVLGGAAGNYMGGMIAEVGVWSVALTTSEIESLASGISPLMVRPDALVFYAPLLTTTGNQLDWVGGVSLSPTNTPTDTDHPAIVYPFQPRAIIPAAGVSAPTISSTSDSNKLIDESSFVITGTNLASATAVTFKQTNRPDYNATAFITANDATTVTLTGLDVQDMSMAYGAATVSVTTAGGTSADFAITIDKKASHTYITLSGLDAGVEWLGLTSADGDQRVSATTTAKGGTFAFVGVDGNYTITYPGTAPTNDSIYWGEFDDSADQWYESNVTINPAAGGSSAAILGLMQHRDRKHLRQR